MASKDRCREYHAEGRCTLKLGHGGPHRTALMPIPTRQATRIALREDAALEGGGNSRIYWAVCFTVEELHWLKERLTGTTLAERVQSVLEMTGDGKA